jgi:APA family basic amino acid/polyamine antiporter
MIGAGVFLTTGFMAQDLDVGWILLAWLVGMLLAMAGARAYAEVALLIPRSGGEYRYLSELFHPAVGYLAGWASLLVGFSAPIAISAFGAAAFVSTVVGPGDTRLGAAALIVALACIHAVGLQSSRRAQNGLVILKGVVVLGFIALGLVFGENQWPVWRPASETSAIGVSFAAGLFFVSYAFSGWNAATYAAEEFERPRRDVPRAMLIGCALVGVAYLLVNWVLVANLTPERARVVFDYEETRVTLAHVVARDFLGEAGSSVVSIGIALILVSSTSAMMLVGPRVCAEMARDGFLPDLFRGKPGAPPRASVFLQGGLAVALLYMHTVGELLVNVAGVLVFFSALVALGLFRARRGSDSATPRADALVAAAVYVSASAWMLYHAFASRTGLIPWLLVASGVALAAYALSSRRLS